MIEYIRQYHQSERNMALVGAASGLVFLLIAWGVYRHYGIEQLNRGLVYTLVIGGLFLLSALGFAFQNSKRMAEVDSFPQTNRELQQTEIQRVEKVLATGYRVSLILSSLLVVGGLALVLISQGNLLRGIGLGILLFGTTMHTLDFFSINNHRIYHGTLLKLEF